MLLSRVELLDLSFDFKNRKNADFRLKFRGREPILGPASNRNLPDFCRMSRNIGRVT